MAQKVCWDGAGREPDARPVWELKRQVASLEDRMASAIACLNRQVLDQRAAPGTLTGSPDFDARLVALEQQQKRNEHCLAALSGDMQAITDQHRVRGSLFALDWHW